MGWWGDGGKDEYGHWDAKRKRRGLSLACGAQAVNWIGVPVHCGPDRGGSLQDLLQADTLPGKMLDGPLASGFRAVAHQVSSC